MALGVLGRQVGRSTDETFHLLRARSRCASKRQAHLQANAQVPDLGVRRRLVCDSRHVVWLVLPCPVFATVCSAWSGGLALQCVVEFPVMRSDRLTSNAAEFSA